MNQKVEVVAYSTVGEGVDARVFRHPKEAEEFIGELEARAEVTDYRRKKADLDE